MAKKSRATRRILWMIGGLVIVLVILGVVGSSMGWLGNQEQAMEVETATAEVRRVTQIVVASGKVQPETEVTISPDVSGEIIDLRIKEGDEVTQGMLLARIKPDFYVAQVEQAQAGVLQAKANMAQRRADMLTAQTELKRQQDLFDKKVISESAYLQAKNQYDVAQAAYEGAEYAVQSAEARLRESNEQLSKTSIYAPMNGTISKLDVELGERVVGTSQMAGTEMMRIARLDQMEIEIDVNENDVVNVALGDTASIEVDAYPERTFHGIVTEIANSARVSGAGTQEQVTNFPVKVRILDVHNQDSVELRDQGVSREEVPTLIAGMPNFRPGMSGTVEVYTQTVPQAVAIPIQAVTVRDFNKVDAGGKPEASADEATEETGAEENAAENASALPGKEDLRKVVFVVAEGEARMVEVETGISDETHIEVTRGLQGGESVIIGPYRAVSRELEPGMKVQVQDPTRRGRPAVAAAQ